jgi:hypothetical protein
LNFKLLKINFRTHQKKLRKNLDNSKQKFIFAVTNNRIGMKIGLSSPSRPVFTLVENFSDQPQFGRQASIGRLPDFPLLLERERERNEG